MNLYTAFYKNSFTINEFGHGGEKRSFQINQLFSDVYELVRVNDLKKIFHPWYTRYWVGLNFLIQLINPTNVALEVPRPVLVGTVENVQI